jgi:hypothetical protein
MRWSLLLVALWCIGCAEVLSLGDFSVGDGGAPPTGSGGEGASGGMGALGGGGASCDAYCELVRSDAPLAYYRLGEKDGAKAAVDEMGNYEASYIEDTISGGDLAFERSGLIASADAAVRFRNGTPLSAILESSDALDFPGNTEFSLELWVNPATLEYGLLIDKSIGLMNGYALMITATPAPAIVFRRYLDGSFDAAEVPLTQVATTIHVAATYDGAVMALYLDGIQVQTAGSSKLLVNNVARLHVGQSVADAVIDEVAIYAHALTAAEVEAHYKTGHNR